MGAIAPHPAKHCAMPLISVRTSMLPIALTRVAGAAPAAAARFDSVYPDLDLDACSIFSANDFSVVRACPGYKGIPVMVAEDDARFLVSYGLDSTREMAASQTLGPFNWLGAKIEWRLSNTEGPWKPFATILRWHTDSGDGNTGQILVVTSIAPGNTCHIARVDAALPDANQLARDAADRLGFAFDCATDQPEIVGP